jgi:imidazolonepropionase-like amidohydrolase
MTSASSESQTMTTLKAANIEADTRIAAQVLGLEKELGTVEEGKLADLILIEGNPLEDIEILAKRELIRLVMKDGKQVSGKFF